MVHIPSGLPVGIIVHQHRVRRQQARQPLKAPSAVLVPVEALAVPGQLPEGLGDVGPTLIYGKY